MYRVFLDEAHHNANLGLDVRTTFMQRVPHPQLCVHNHSTPLHVHSGLAVPVQQVKPRHVCEVWTHLSCVHLSICKGSVVAFLPSSDNQSVHLMLRQDLYTPINFGQLLWSHRAWPALIQPSGLHSGYVCLGMLHRVNNYVF